MFRVAMAVAEKENAQAVVTGESLGQVASQTLQNLMVVSGAIKFPILRPLIGFDKEDIIKIAREIGTYEISIQPSLCCTIVPKKPATSAKIEEVAKEEEKVDIEKMLKESLKNYAFKLCKTTTSYEAIPKKQIKLNLDKCEEKLKDHGYTVVCNAKVMLIVKKRVRDKHLSDGSYDHQTQQRGCCEKRNWGD